MPDARAIDSSSLDRLVARHVFGVRDRSIGYYSYDEDRSSPNWIPSGKPWRTHQIEAEPLPRFSTDIRAAWDVLRAMHGRLFSVRRRFYDALDSEVQTAIPLPPWAHASWPDVLGFLSPAHICLAALRALGVDVPAELAKLRP